MSAQDLEKQYDDALTVYFATGIGLRRCRRLFLKWRRALSDAK